MIRIITTSSFCCRICLHTVTHVISPVTLLAYYHRTILKKLWKRSGWKVSRTAVASEGLRVSSRAKIACSTKVKQLFSKNTKPWSFPAFFCTSSCRFFTTGLQAEPRTAQCNVRSFRFRRVITRSCHAVATASCAIALGRSEREGAA